MCHVGCRDFAQIVSSGVTNPAALRCHQLRAHFIKGAVRLGTAPQAANTRRLHSTVLCRTPGQRLTRRRGCPCTGLHHAYLGLRRARTNRRPAPKSKADAKCVVQTDTTPTETEGGHRLRALRLDVWHSLRFHDPLP